MTNQRSTLPPVPPQPEQAPFTAQYKRHGWEATVHYVYDKSNNIRAYVSNEYVVGTPTLRELSRISTKIHADFTKWISEVRLIQWANDNAMFFNRWKQLANGQLVPVLAMDVVQ